MANVGYATLSVIPSFNGFRSQLERGAAGDLTAAGRSGGRRYGDAAGREAGSRFQSGFKQQMKNFAGLAGLTLGGAAVVDFFKDAVGGASDLGEAGTKLQAIYGEAAAEVQSYASTAATNLGQTRLQALDAAATFGTFGKAAGLAGSDLAGFSTELVTLSTDMASFYNTDISTAIEAIGSGLRGEAEPLRAFGVLLDDASLRQEALAQGLIKTTKDALTPQQKVLAAHAVIMKQTADAQGDFERTGDGLANQQRKLIAQWEEMKVAVGEDLLPVVTSFVGFLNRDGLPALGAVGGVVKDGVSAFTALPAPVLAASAAFAALRIAAVTGLSASAAAGATAMGSAMVGLRLRTMFAVDAFRLARTGSIVLNGNLGVVTQGVNRLTASMIALRAAATANGGTLARSLSGAMALVGGPWGAALIGGTVILTKFWQEHEEAKQRVDDLKTSLDAQTGALTENTRATAIKRLEDEGALEAAQNLGISLLDMTDAALGNEAALARVRDRLREVAPDALNAGKGLAAFDVTLSQGDKDAHTIGEALQNLGEDLNSAKDSAARMATATRDSSAATQDATRTTESYATQLDKARDRLQKLIDAEQKRRDNAVRNRRDELALISVMQDARKEAREGARTLDDSTEAGQRNWEALLNLADQWNNSSNKVRNARGAYRDMRQNFIELAEQMGASEEKAKRLADRFLSLPRRKAIHVETPGMDQALADMKRLRWLAEAPGRTTLEIKLKGDSYAGMEPRLNGGRVNAGQPYLVGERRPEVFVPDRPGRIEKDAGRFGAGGVTINIENVNATSGGSFMDDMRSRAQAAVGGGRRR